MKYIIMCGGNYIHWAKPKHTLEINGEAIVARTIRLLREAGIDDIAISSNNPIFEQFGVPVLNHKNRYEASPTSLNCMWVDAFYPTDEPTCYIFGDVVFSPEAIKTIVQTPTKDIEFFGSAPPFSAEYPKKWAEPFALKVINNKHLRESCDWVRANVKKFRRMPIMWELWQVIKGTPLNTIDYRNYTIINDYTCDIDYEKEIPEFEALLKLYDTASKSVEPNKAHYMIHTMPKREWYVQEFLIPSMLKQGIKRDQITIYSDVKGEKNLIATMKSWLTLDDDGGTWHLQDDIILAHDFKRKTEQFDDGIVCTFKSWYDGKAPYGLVEQKDMWFSFPCIRIPNKYAKECAEWVLNDIIGNPIYRKWWEKGSNDDLLFRKFMEQTYPKVKATNLNPNIIDHVAFLIGGSVNNPKPAEELAKIGVAKAQVRSKLWNDEYLVEALRKQLRRR